MQQNEPVEAFQEAPAIPHEHPSPGLEDVLAHPLLSAIFQRRSRRISKGLKSVPAGSLSYGSRQEPQPLTELEEALLIAATGVTGVTMPDQPFTTEDGKPLVGSPMVDVVGRAAASPDNAQATHFFLINDSGTYFLRRPEGVDPLASAGLPLTAERLIGYARQCKVKVLDKRLDFPREYPYYLGRNRYVSNVPGSTILVPVVDLTRQYINGIMFLLTQDDGQRPTFIDDWNFYRLAGVKKWVKNKFLNEDLKIPLGALGSARIQIEADLLLQNIFLMIQALGLGGWIHAAFVGPVLLGDEEYRSKGHPGLGFRFHRPHKPLRNLFKFLFPLPTWRDNPVGLDGVLEGYCPPYYESMNAAIDKLLEHKYGPAGLYRDPKDFDRVFRPGLAKKFCEEVPHYTEEVVACCKDICNYIFDTYDRFPAHVDAMFVPGVWIQAHHLDLAYYDQLYVNGYSATQARHQSLWHGSNGR